MTLVLVWCMAFGSATLASLAFLVLARTMSAAVWLAILVINVVSFVINAQVILGVNG
jgi:hypothetical protein